MYRAMLSDKTSDLLAEMAWAGVRIGGWWGWLWHTPEEVEKMRCLTACQEDLP